MTPNRSRNVAIGLLFVTVLCAGEFACGQESERADASTQALVVNAWQRDTVIHVAVFNRSEKPETASVGVGVHDVGDRVFSTSTAAIASHSFQLLMFPTTEVVSPRGDAQRPDSVFVSAPHIESWPQPIQNAYPDRTQGGLDNYLVQAGSEVVFEFRPRIAPALQLLFVPRTIDAGAGIECTGESLSDAMRPLSQQEFSGIDLPGPYRDEILARTGGNFAFLLPAGQREPVRIRYVTPAVADCANVAIPFYQYTLAADGSIQSGGGVGAVFTVYNPDAIRPDFANMAPAPSDAGTLTRKQPAPKSAEKPAP